ncbi:hypothetical protein Tco_0738712 [Tanacetum coccineum]
MLVDALQQHEVGGQVDRMVEKVRGLEIKWEMAKVAKEMAEMAKEVDEVANEVVEVVKKVISPKDYDGKGSRMVYTRWIKKIESVQDMTGCGENQNVKYTACSFINKAQTWWKSQIQKLETEFWCHAMVGAGHVAYTDRFHELSRLVPYLVTPENKMIERYIYGFAPHICAMVEAVEPTTIQSVVQKVRMLTDEAIRNGALKKVTEKRGNSKVPSKDGKSRDDNKRPKTGRAFATVTNSVRKEYTGTAPKCPNYSFHHMLEMPCRKCTNCNRLGHFAKDYRRGLGGNRPNQVMAIEGGQGRGKNDNQASGEAFMMGAKEARQDPNIVTGIESSDLNFSYEIKIASRQLVEINKVICERHESFDVIVAMDWLSKHKDEIVCHEKVVSIPLPNGKILRVLWERPEEKVRHLLSAKVKEQKLKDIVVVRNLSEVFPDDLLGLPPSREIEFHIDLIRGAMPIVKSLYRLAPREFDMIVGMDWLIRYEAEIVCQENVVRITLLHDELLRVLRENPEEKARYLMSAKTEEQKLKDIIVVRNFPELFPDELSGLPPS